MIRLPSLLLIIGLAGCGFGSHRTRNFPAMGHVAEITVRESDKSNPTPKITDSARISQIISFVDSHREGWYAPWYGVPVPTVSIEFYDGTEFKGGFGVGKNFLETQREGGFYSQDATPDEVNRFLAVLAPTSGQPQWQNVDQLCGDLEFGAPKRKTTVVNGKEEKELYAQPVKNAEVVLYRGTPSDEACCKDTGAMGRTRSNSLGKFEFPGFQHGWYWLRISKHNFTVTMPLHVTSDFEAKSCRDRSVGRIFTVDARPPGVETRIY